jgi:hypothetical protein
MLSIIEFPDIFSKICATNAGMALHIHEVSQSKDYLKYQIAENV